MLGREYYAWGMDWSIGACDCHWMFDDGYSMLCGGGHPDLKGGHPGCFVSQWTYGIQETLWYIGA